LAVVSKKISAIPLKKECKKSKAKGKNSLVSIIPKRAINLLIVAPHHLHLIVYQRQFFIIAAILYLKIFEIVIKNWN